MSQSVTGGFVERVMTRNAVSDSFVEGEFSAVVIARRVEYYSGSIGTGPKHVGPVEVFERLQENSGGSYGRDVGVAPEVYAEIRVPEVNERLTVEVPVGVLASLGGFSSVSGSFRLPDESFDVRFDADEVEVKGVGTFARAGEVSDTMTYSAWQSQRRRVFDRGYECGKVVDKRLREAWAKEVGVHSFVAEIAEVEESEYSSSATFHVEAPSEGDVSPRFSFRVSIDEWDENPALRALVNTDGGGEPPSPEGERVYVSMNEFEGGVAEDGSWTLYREHARSNVVRSLASRVRALL